MGTVSRNVLAVLCAVHHMRSPPASSPRLPLSSLLAQPLPAAVVDAAVRARSCVGFPWWPAVVTQPTTPAQRAEAAAAGADMLFVIFYPVRAAPETKGIIIRMALLALSPAPPN